jgi:hypothetical protein
MTTKTDDPLLDLASLASHHFSQRYVAPTRLGPPKKKRKSRALPTKASIKRRVAAAREAGLDVSAIQPDGTILTGKPSEPTAAPDDSKWSDLRA